VTAALDAAIRGFAWFSIIYFTVLNTAYLGLIALAAVDAGGASRRLSFSGRAAIFHSPLAPPVSIVVPARDAADFVVGSVHGLLNLRYPEFEVILVEDGSTDATFERLQAEFGLVEVDRVIRDEIPTMGRVLSVHAPRRGGNLLVIRKTSMGRPADAVNVGVNAARYPLVCRIDADTYLDADALLAVAGPFIEDPARTVAVGSTIRVANNCVVSHGRVVQARMPGGWLPAVQAVEYVRAFLLGRAGWSQIRGMLFISGAFGVFRRDVFAAVGGFHLHSEGDDVEMVTGIHHMLRDQRRPYRIGFVPDPCCWTIVPGRYRALARQRSRWSQILSEALWIHRRMLFNPRYGAVGLLILPFYLIFELGSAVVELFGFAALAAGLALGIVNAAVALLFIAAALGYAIFLTLVGLLIEELTYHRYRSWRDFGLLAYAAVAENIGYRQIYAWWRLRGIVAALTRRKADWATQVGGQPGAPAPEAPVLAGPAVRWSP
jgi:cellulose synthase/poly-beta-1,6-N-acetylglucosamine synthase-like glycosyltransferase